MTTDAQEYPDEEQRGLSYDDILLLRDSGFTEREIERLQESASINIETPTWHSAIESRQVWQNDRMAEGWSEEEIEAIIDGYYEIEETHSPWDFIKAEYQPPVKLDYQKGVQQRAQMKIKDYLPDYQFSPEVLDLTEEIEELEE